MRDVMRHFRDSRPVTFENFIQLVTGYSTKVPTTTEEIRRVGYSKGSQCRHQVFRLFDSDGTGVISASILKNVCDEIGMSQFDAVLVYSSQESSSTKQRSTR